MNGLGRVGLWLLRGLGRLRHGEPAPPFTAPTHVTVSAYQRATLIHSWRQRTVTITGTTGTMVMRRRQVTKLAADGKRRLAVIATARRAVVAGSGKTQAKVSTSCA